MGIGDRAFRLSLVTSIQNRVRRIPQNGSTLAAFGRYQSRAFALIWIAAALIAGKLANSWSSDAAIRDWERTHLPAPGVWSATLGGAGFQEITQLRDVERGIRGLPLTLDSQGAAWISEDLRRVVVFHPQVDSHDSIPALYSRDPKITQGRAAPLQWTPLGRSWSALSRAWETTQNAPVQANLKPAKSRAEPPDPRELRY